MVVGAVGGGTREGEWLVMVLGAVVGGTRDLQMSETATIFKNQLKMHASTKQIILRVAGWIVAA